jgi:hypothetical protein
MTEGTPDERRPHALDEDEPEVEGHVLRQGPEDVPAEAERRPHSRNEDEGGDEHGLRQ